MTAGLGGTIAGGRGEATTLGGGADSTGLSGGFDLSPHPINVPRASAIMGEHAPREGILISPSTVGTFNLL
jgi:hypothetical protein